MEGVVFACLRDVLLQSIAHIPIQAFNIEMHIASVELSEHFGFCEDVRVDSKERGDFIFLDVNQVLIGQVLQQDVASVGAVIGESIENSLLPLYCILVVSILLIFYELIEAILFIVLVVVDVALGVPIFKKKIMVSFKSKQNSSFAAKQSCIYTKQYSPANFGSNLLFCPVNLLFIVIVNVFW